MYQKNPLLEKHNLLFPAIKDAFTGNSNIFRDAVASTAGGLGGFVAGDQLGKRAIKDITDPEEKKRILRKYRISGTLAGGATGFGLSKIPSVKSSFQFKKDKIREQINGIKDLRKNMFEYRSDLAKLESNAKTLETEISQMTKMKVSPNSNYTFGDIMNDHQKTRVIGDELGKRYGFDERSKFFQQLMDIDSKANELNHLQDKIKFCKRHIEVLKQFAKEDLGWAKDELK